MLPELDARGVEVVTICGDTSSLIKKGRSMHGLPAVMLSDADLEVTDTYNLRHSRALAPKPGVIVSLPIPTTILVDADGVVRWIDQATDYQQRSHPDRVLGAVDASIPAPA